MHVSLNLVLELLNCHSCRTYIDAGRPLCFERLSLLPESGEEIDRARLYVGELSLALSLREQGKDFFCVCVRDRVSDHAETEEVLRGLIVINENISCRRIFARLQDLFYTVNEWVSTMRRYAYEKRPLQEILELSEPVIGNFISISDSALSLICYTRHIPVDDPVNVKLLANGFHPEETITAFREQGLFETWDRSVGLLMNTGRKLSPYDICSKVFRLHNTYYIHMVMTCNHRPLTPGLADLFQMLADVLSLYIKQDWQQYSYTRHDYDSLLIELVEDRAGDDSVVSERVKHLDLETEGPYQLCLIECKTMEKLPIGRLGMILSDQFPDAKVTIYQNRILLLLRAAAGEEGSMISSEKLTAWLETYDAVCAASGVFDRLTGIHLAYEQTVLVFKYMYAAAQPSQEIGRKPGRIAEYDSCFFLTMLGENPESRMMWQTTKYYRMLKKIREYDEKNGMNNVQLLYTFLFCDCRASDAGALLHMHRNNVLYRISRVEELLGVSLSDRELKYGLLNAYPFLQLYGV